MLQFFAILFGNPGRRKKRTLRWPQPPRVRPGVEPLEPRTVLSAASAAATLATTSTNWSGYAIETNLTTPQARSVSAVSGTWVVPNVTGTGNTFSAVWVGIDGYSSSTVEQIGIEADIANGKAAYSAWYEMYPSYPVTISGMTINPGDTISAGVSYASGSFTLQIADSTSGKSFSTVQAGTSDQRSSAEWIVEAPSSGFGVLPLADFGIVSFSQASATVNGTAGPIDDAAWQDAAIDMSSRSGQEDTTSALTDSTTATGTSSTTTSSFSVTYDAAAAPAPPPRHHHGFGFFAPDLSASQESAELTSIIITATAGAGPSATVMNPVLVHPAAVQGTAQPLPTNIALSSAAPVYSISFVRAGMDLDQRHSNEEAPTAARDDSRALPPEMLVPHSASEYGTVVAFSESVKRAAVHPDAAGDRVFGMSPLLQDSWEGSQDAVEGLSGELAVLWSVGLTAFVTDWYLCPARDEREDSPF